MSASPTTKDTAAQIQELRATNEALVKRLDDMGKAPDGARSVGPFSVPNVRRGESSQTSRGYSYLKYFGLLSGNLSKEEARVEWDMHDKLQKVYSGYFGGQKGITNSVMAPFASRMLAEIPGQEGLAQEMEQVTKAGLAGWDPEHLQFERRRMAQMGYTKALSWVDETSGGALVGPPLMGELIEVLRNNEVFMQAGCRVIAMPPNGRLVYPRQTSAATAYWVGESATITDSLPNTGDVTLTAKKLGILVKIPNELFHFSSVSIEQFVREDISRVLALKLDKTLLEDVGSSTTPKGLINYAGVNALTSLDPGNNKNGNSNAVTSGALFDPSDPSNMVATVESQNAVFRSFIMRPLVWAGISTRRWDSVAAGDQRGGFVFNLIRDLPVDLNLSRTMPGNLQGYPVYKTTQVSKTRSNGTKSNLTYVLGGDFADYILALNGAVEFQVSTQGDQPFTTDQTWFRGILYSDGVPRHEASFAYYDNMIEG